MKPARQARSEQTVERIVESTEALMAERLFPEISVAEICAHANVSSSSFYARFATKQDLLVCLQERLNARKRQILDEAADLVRLADAPISELIEQAALAVLTHQAEEQAFFERMRSMEAAVEDLGRARRETSAYMEEVFLAAILARPDIGPERTDRIRFASRMLLGGLADAVHQPENFATALGLELSDVATEAARMWVRYVFDDERS